MKKPLLVKEPPQIAFAQELALRMTALLFSFSISLPSAAVGYILPNPTSSIVTSNEPQETAFQLLGRTTQGLFGIMSEEEKQTKLAEYDAKFQQDIEERNQYYAEKWMKKQQRQTVAAPSEKQQLSFRDIFVSQEKQEMQARRQQYAEKQPLQQPYLKQIEQEMPVENNVAEPSQKLDEASTPSSPSSQTTWEI